jgi:hypothetical protein
VWEGAQRRALEPGLCGAERIAGCSAGGEQPCPAVDAPEGIVRCRGEQACADSRQPVDEIGGKPAAFCVAAGRAGGRKATGTQAMCAVDATMRADVPSPTHGDSLYRGPGVPC